MSGLLRRRGRCCGGRSSSALQVPSSWMMEGEIRPRSLSDIAYECGRIESLYYSITELYHVGRRPHPQQAERAKLMEVATQVIKTMMHEHMDNVVSIIQEYRK